MMIQSTCFAWTVASTIALLAACGGAPTDSGAELDQAKAEEALTPADATPDPGPPPGTKPAVSPGDGTVGGAPLSSVADVYYCKDALLQGFEWFDRLHGWFPSVMHTSHANSPTHQVVNMAYATTGTMTFKNVTAPAAGRYTLTFRYAFASGLFGGVNDRPMGIKVNGTVVAPAMSFPITGSFSVYQDASVDIPLASGRNEIEIFNISEHGVSRVDTMTVAKKP